MQTQQQSHDFDSVFTSEKAKFLRNNECLRLAIFEDGDSRLYLTYSQDFESSVAAQTVGGVCHIVFNCARVETFRNPAPKYFVSGRLLGVDPSRRRYKAGERHGLEMTPENIKAEFTGEVNEYVAIGLGHIYDEVQTRMAAQETLATEGLEEDQTAKERKNSARRRGMTFIKLEGDQGVEYVPSWLSAAQIDMLKPYEIVAVIRTMAHCGFWLKYPDVARQAMAPPARRNRMMM